MKKYLLVLVIPLLMGAACSKQQKVENTESNFAKKKECSSFIDDVKNDIEIYNNSRVPEYRNSDNSGGINMGLYKEVKAYKEVFYSPKNDTCISVITMNTLVQNTGNTDIDKEDIKYWSPVYSTFYINDLLTDKELETIQSIHRGAEFYNFQEIQDKIDNYR